MPRGVNTGSSRPIESSLDAAHLLQTFLDNTPDHVYFKDLEGRFTQLSHSLALWLGFEDITAAIGSADADVFAAEHAGPARRQELEVMRTGESIVGVEEKEIWLDGHISWVSTTKVALYDREERVVGIFGTSRDITPRKLLEAREQEQAEALATLAGELEQLSLRDELTALFNRRGFEQLGDAAIGAARQGETEICVLFMDLDGLKAINDRFGHAAGDQALIHVAKTLRAAVRSTDVVGRIGGDEFAAVVAGLSSTAVDKLCDRVRTETVADEASPHPISVSIGVAMAAAGSRESLSELLVAADRAMYDGRHRRRKVHVR